MAGGTAPPAAFRRRSPAAGAGGSYGVAAQYLDGRPGGRRCLARRFVGEMALYFGLADAALLGGSFAPLGGQNLIEAAACGVPVFMGPHVFNFEEAAALSAAAGAAFACGRLDAGGATGDSAAGAARGIGRLARCRVGLGRRAPRCCAAHRAGRGSLHQGLSWALMAPRSVAAKTPAACFNFNPPSNTS